jgi:PPOX class probable F420-dependent enzyme
MLLTVRRRGEERQMVNQRSRIALTDDEQRELLESARTIHIATINGDGRPHVVPMWFELDDDGLIVFTTYEKAQKVANLERDPRLTAMLETGEAYNELRGMSIDGDAEVVRDPHVTMRTLALVGSKIAGRPRPDPDPDVEPAGQALKRVTVRIHPTRIRSWDHRKVG